MPIPRQIIKALTISLLALLLLSCNKENPPRGVVTDKKVLSDGSFMLVLRPLDGCKKGHRLVYEEDFIAFEIGDTACMWMNLYGCPKDKGQ